MAKKSQDAVKQGVDPNAWMVTFSDLLMLLLTFFVMLLSMSSMDTKKLKSILLHIQNAAGLLEFSSTREVGRIEDLVKKHKQTERMFMIDKDLLRDFFVPSVESDIKVDEEEELSKLIKISDDERGIVFSFQEDILFEPGKAELKKGLLNVLDSMARAMYSCPNDILIMGHTDNQELKGEQSGSNWELSCFRASSVAEYFIEKKELPSSRFSVGGYGPSRPLYPNDTPGNRALNRRVEIIFQHS